MSKRKLDNYSTNEKKPKKTEKISLDRFYDACKYGNLDIVKQGIHENIDFDSQIADYSQLTPLHMASMNGRYEVVHELVKAGANIESRNYRGSTPLQYACYYNYLDISQELINAGANIYSENNYGHRALDIACIHGHLPIVRELIKTNVNVDVENSNGYTPLYHACDARESYIVAELMRYTSYQSIHKVFTSSNRFAQKNNLMLSDELTFRSSNCFAQKNNLMLSDELTKRKRVYSQLTKMLFITQKELNSILSCLPRDMIQEIVQSLKSIL
jgi:ankyrin repeat protein